MFKFGKDLKDVSATMVERLISMFFMFLGSESEGKPPLSYVFTPAAAAAVAAVAAARCWCCDAVGYVLHVVDSSTCIYSVCMCVVVYQVTRRWNSRQRCSPPSVWTPSQRLYMYVHMLNRSQEDLISLL